MTDTQKNAAVEAFQPLAREINRLFREYGSDRPDHQGQVLTLYMRDVKRIRVAIDTLASLPTTEQSLAGKPVVWVSGLQLASVADRPQDTGGEYIPVRKSPAGQFTMPLYATPQPAPVTGGEDAVERVARALEVAMQNASISRGWEYFVPHARAAIAALSPSAPKAPSEREKLIAELVEALERANGMVESAMKVTNWSPVSWDEDSPCVEFEALITRARKIGGAS